MSSTVELRVIRWDPITSLSIEQRVTQREKGVQVMGEAIRGLVSVPVHCLLHYSLLPYLRQVSHLIIYAGPICPPLGGNKDLLRCTPQSFARSDAFK